MLAYTGARQAAHRVRTQLQSPPQASISGWDARRGAAGTDEDTRLHRQPCENSHRAAHAPTQVMRDDGVDKQSHGIVGYRASC